MASTRFHDDPARIAKRLNESTFSGRYSIDVPGPGSDMPYLEDPQIRIQRWGANMRTNHVNLESDLRGMTRHLNHDNISVNDFKANAVGSMPISHSTSGSYVDESRATHPAWIYRGLVQNRWETPILDPQYGLEKPFIDNISTRILEKDYFKPSIPVINGVNDYYLTGTSILHNK
jgi:hypothetical protein